VLRCAQCPRNFSDEYSLGRHYDQKHRLLNGASVCPHACTTDYQNLSNNNEHLAGPKHAKKLDVACPAAGCGERFEAHAAVMAHHAEVHEQENRPELRLELFTEQVAVMGFMLDFQEEVDAYCEKVGEALSQEYFHRDLRAHNEALLLAIEDGAVVSHVLLKLLRAPEMRAGWVLKRQRAGASDYAYWKLLDTAYRFVCAQRLLNFCIVVMPDELNQMQ